MLSIIEKEDMVFDGKGGKMEKMAFTLYSEIVGMGMKAQLLIEDDTLLAHNSIIAEKDKEIAELKVFTGKTKLELLREKDSEIARLRRELDKIHSLTLLDTEGICIITEIKDIAHRALKGE